MKRAVVILIGILFLQHIPVLSCTIFIAKDGKQVLVGNNEDYSPLKKTYIWVRPSKQQKKGYIFWGFEEKFPEGGINEQGLFYDAAALPQEVEIVKDPAKPDFEGYILEKILQECGTVEEALKIFARYNLTWQQKAQIMIADRTGDYAIVHANYIIRPGSNNYVLTNYNLQDRQYTDFKCWRRKTAYNLLQTKPLSLENFTNILDATAQRETDNSTVYSQVCDLKNKTIYLYQRHDYTVVHKIDVLQLLKKGYQDIEIKDLFHKTLSEKIEQTYNQQGIAATISMYKQQRKSKNTSYQFAEKDLEILGYRLIDSNRIADAEKLFETNLSYYPDSENAQAALANACLLSGKTEKANKLYNQIRKINPSNYYLNLFGPQHNIITFRIKGMQGAESIALTGTFNNYDPKANPFIRKDGEWICTLHIPSGKYAYKIYVDNTYWMQDPGNLIHTKPNEWWDSYLQVQ
ncbi:MULTISPECIES: tetratricopeptide repeat protein [unclassified Sphingobacterium]|uniref:tetratricopeptide repeat protein n=1 Tax=unclassified Sphingobacterium TaxID=2609468 RepID=UPI0025F1F6A3|nr:MULTISPECIES: tetratricopeptide repeat protein [unclassified Sphingobacterium]